MSSFAQLVEKKRKAKQDADKAREAKALRLSQPEVHETDLISGKVTRNSKCISTYISTDGVGMLDVAVCWTCRMLQQSLM